MVSEKMRFKIANVCYANVAGEFAIFANPRMRGANFTWGWFIQHCEENSIQWLRTHNIKSSPEIVILAKDFSKAIAETLVERFLDKKLS